MDWQVWLCALTSPGRTAWPVVSIVRAAWTCSPIASRGPTARSSDTIEGAAALKQEASTTCRRPKNRKPCSTTRAVTPSKAERRPEARAKGYEGLAASAGTSLW